MKRITQNILIGLIVMAGGISIYETLAASTIIDNTSITTTQVTAVNLTAHNISISGTCLGCGSHIKVNSITCPGGQFVNTIDNGTGNTGCVSASGGVTEGNYTNYNTVVLNQTEGQGPLINDAYLASRVDDNGNVLYSGKYSNVYTTIGGTVLFSERNANTTTGRINQDSGQQSINGEYQVSPIFNFGTFLTDFKVFKNGVFLQNLHLNRAQFNDPVNNNCGGFCHSGATITISPDGHYIAMVVNTNTDDRLIVFQGN